MAFVRYGFKAALISRMIFSMERPSYYMNKYTLFNKFKISLFNTMRFDIFFILASFFNRAVSSVICSRCTIAKIILKEIKKRKGVFFSMNATILVDMHNVSGCITQRIATSSICFFKLILGELRLYVIKLLRRGIACADFESRGGETILPARMTLLNLRADCDIPFPVKVFLRNSRRFDILVHEIRHRAWLFGAFR